MKNIVIFILTFSFAFFSCKKEMPARLSTVDFDNLQKRMDADKDVIKVRVLFSEYSRILAAFPSAEYTAIVAKIKSCGYSPSVAPISELKKCLANTPNGDEFIKGQELIREHDDLLKLLKRKIPEFGRLTPEERASLLVKVNVEQATILLNSHHENK